MVRILVFTSFFLSFSAFAHDSGAYKLPDLHCEHTLNNLNRAQIDAYRFLKRLQIEADDEVPSQDFARLAVGRAIAPLAAAMDDVATIPLEMNFYKPLRGEEKENLWKVLRTYLPSQLGNKKLVVMLYAETVPSVLLFARMFVSYLQENKITNKVQFRVYTSQKVLREMSKGLTEYDYSFRPIGAANEVRHWFHDGLSASVAFNYSQYPVIDVHRQTVKEDRALVERPAFTTLRQEIHNLD